MLAAQTSTNLGVRSVLSTLSNRKSPQLCVCRGELHQTVVSWKQLIPFFNYWSDRVLKFSFFINVFSPMFTEDFTITYGRVTPGELSLFPHPSWPHTSGIFTFLGVFLYLWDLIREKTRHTHTITYIYIRARTHTKSIVGLKGRERKF